MSNYLTAKEIHLNHGVKPSTLKYYRQNNVLKNIQWTAGHGKPFYDVDEVRKVCPDFKENARKVIISATTGAV
jgi:hypothetical protein